MGDAVQMLVGGPRWFHILCLGIGSLLLQVFLPYTRYVNYLKWLAFSLFAYVITVFMVHVPWNSVLRQTFLPPLSNIHGDYVKMIVAVLGTTISPYLFFWQASQESEEVKDRRLEKPLRKAPEQAKEQFSRIKLDTYLGMAASNLVAFFIMLTAAVTLHAHGNTNIQTATEAAKALEPLAGRYAYILFSLGIIGTGLLAVPVLAGSAAYASGEALGWRISLEVKPWKAKKFNLALAAAMLFGLSLDFIHLNPIKALFIAAVINGILAAPVMAMVMIIAQNSGIMGEFRIPHYLRILGWAGTIVMAIASLALLLQLI